MYPPFQQRLYRVLDCGSVASFWLHTQDRLYANRTHYFVEALSLRYYEKKGADWIWYAKPAEPHICYYLGSYQNYWNYKNNVLVFAHNLMTTDVYGIGMTPHLPGEWWWVIQRVKKFGWIDYYGEVKGNQLIQQNLTLARRKDLFDDCLQKNYTRTPEEIRRKRRPKDFEDNLRNALGQMGIGTQPRTLDPFKQRTPEDWEKLRQDYIAENGYVIRIPGVEDIIRTKPNFMKTEEEIKLEKKMALIRIMESPAYEYMHKFASVMTWMDNVQDTTSVIYPALRFLAWTTPRAFSKILPVLGWLMLPMELLNYGIALGRALGGVGSMKRASCDLFKHNPFGKKAQFLRKERIANFKPGWGDVIQALQVLQQFTGMGLSLGAIIGTAYDVVFGAYRYLNGDKVRIGIDPPSMQDYEKYAGRGIRASALISTAGQVFDETTHFWNSVCGALSTMVIAPISHAVDIGGAIEDPMDIVIPADVPTNPITLAVIKEAGLKVEDGVGWPFNGEKEISLGDLTDAIATRSQNVTRDYMFRHTKDWYGFVAANLWDHTIPIIMETIDPSGETVMDDTDEMKVLYRMIKAPLLPIELPSKTSSQEFFDWCNQHKELTGHLPGIQAIAEKFDLMGIKYGTKYPTVGETTDTTLWPEGFPGAYYP